MTRYIKKTLVLSLLLLTVMAVVLLTACTGGGNDGKETEAATSGGETLPATQPESDAQTDPGTEAPTEEQTVPAEEETESTSTETETVEETVTEAETEDPLLAYYNGEDITVVPLSQPEIPVGRLTILGHDISEFKIISTEEDRSAASTLRDYIAKATGVNLECVREHTGETFAYEIVVGVCESRSPDAVKTRRDTLGDEGYLVYTEGNRLYISGATMRGTWYGVISFLEDFIGCRFFTNDCEVVLPAEAIDIGEGVDTVFVPPFFYRVEYAEFCNNTTYSAKHKLNSYIVGNLDGYGGGVSYAGGAYVHTFRQLAEMENYQIGDQPCLTDPEVYETVLKNVRQWLRDNRNATIVSVTPNDSYLNQKGCQCENCRALDEKYGSPMGSLLTFVNRIAVDIRDEFPNVYVETMAYHYTQTPPVGLQAEDNVIVRMCPTGCCMVHGITGCEMGDTFEEDIQAWSKICKNLSIWHYSVNFANYLAPLPNLFSIYDDVQLYRSCGVISVFDEAAYNSKTGEFEELRAYLLSKLMWNPDMTREEYEQHMNEFLMYYYGNGWEYIRRYIDATYARIGEESHFTHAADLTTIFKVVKTDTDKMEFLYAMCGLFDKALEQASTEEQKAHLRKGSIQIQYLTLSSVRNRDEEKNEYLFNLIKEAGITAISEGRAFPDEVNFRQVPSTW